jgi:hypothetical protein
MTDPRLITPSDIDPRLLPARVTDPRVDGPVEVSPTFQTIEPPPMDSPDTLGRIGVDS